MINPFKKWKPKGKIYSFRCTQCGDAFISSHNLDAPLCGNCIQKIKSLDSTVDNEKKCSECGNAGVIYGKDRCYSCYFSFKKNKWFFDPWRDSWFALYSNNKDKLIYVLDCTFPFHVKRQ
jgi:predicted RNA-binding Zn-ribbon protein involved in translation (DUF1610 family)